MRLDGGERGAGAGDHRPGGVVLDAVQPSEAEDDLTVVARHASADQAGVPALGHDGRARCGADRQDPGDLRRVRRAHHGPRTTAEPAGPVALVPGGEGRVGQHVLGADDLR